jgi:hypothetical protein
VKTGIQGGGVKENKGDNKVNKLSITIIVILGIALVGVGIFCFTLNQDKNTLTGELYSVQGALSRAQAELAATNITLASTQQTLSSTIKELTSTKDTLTSTKVELVSTKDTLSSTLSELSTTNQTLTTKLAELTTAGQQLTTAQNSLNTLQSSISKTQQQLTTAQETLKGLGITLSASVMCWDVQLVDNTAAKNPTWKELMAFLAQDKTENHTYILNTYDCSQFSRDVHNNAEAAGIRAAEVQIRFEGEKTGHALNAFLTTDYGLVYIDCTGLPDKVAFVQKGKTFKAVDFGWANSANIRNESWFNSQPMYYYMATSTGSHAVTSGIEIFW